MAIRTVNNEIPSLVEYDATEKARELAPVFWYLGVWTERHVLEPIASEDEEISISEGRLVITRGGSQCTVVGFTPPGTFGLTPLLVVVLVARGYASHRGVFRCG